MSGLTLVATREAGTIGTRNRKMPGTSYALPTWECITGGKLSDVKNSVCHDCYAKDSEKMYPSVRQGRANNFARGTAMVESDPERFARFMAFQIEHFAAKFAEPYHRWFDSGDLPSVAYLRAIVRVCELTPAIKHWLPTREGAAGGVEPANLVIRISSTMIGDGPRTAPNTSTVHVEGQAYEGHRCPSHEAANRAFSPDGTPACRACWDKAIGKWERKAARPIG